MSNFSLIDAINYINSKTNNRNIIQGDIYQANPDDTYNVRVTIDQRMQEGETYEEKINILNRKSENDLSYVVQDALDTVGNLNVPVLLSCPNGDINRSTIKGLAQYNCPPNPTVYHMESITCFLAGTLVKTKYGDIPIENIKRGMKIHTYNIRRERIEPANVRELLIHGKPEELKTEYFLIKTASSEVRVTKNHEFFDGIKYTPISDIKNIYIYKNEKIVKELILSKTLITCDPVITYNLALPENSNKNYFAEGYLVHNAGIGK